MIDYQVIFLDIPSDEAVTENEDGSYTIFISANLSPEAQRRSFLHAMFHIVRNQLEDKEADVNKMELETHGI